MELKEKKDRKNMVKLEYYAKNYYRSPYRRKFNYQIFGDMYCFSFKDRLEKVLEIQFGMQK